jgi:peptidoglycan hydrolase-like protein with peptidoglycan-binding domain
MPRNLEVGNSGPDVRTVQQALNLRRQPDDPRIDEDGAFGPNTAAAVRRFQDNNELDPDGIVGPLTRVALFPLATVTMRAVGMRLRLPGFDRPKRELRPNLLPGRLTLGSDPLPDPSPSVPTLPQLRPLFGYQPIRYPRLAMPIATPSLTPASFPGLTLPVHHFEIAPGSTVSLFDRNRRIDFGFSMTLSGIVMIGDEKLTHNEFSSGIALSTPGLRAGGNWTVGWFAQITHVHQLNRAGNFSWQPNAQVLNGSLPLPFLTFGASPFVVQFDANDNISFTLGGPSATATFDPNGRTLTWSLANIGLVGKFN